MADHVAVPKNVRFLDALDRAWRTFYALVGADLLIALATGIQQALDEGDPFTGAFWWMLVVLLVKTIISTFATFLLRYAKQPKVVGTEVTR